MAAWKWKGQRAALIAASCGLVLAIAECIGLGMLGSSVVRIYMGSDTRACQLLAGCCVALLAQCGLLPRLSKFASLCALAAVLGLALHPLPLVSQMIATAVLGGVLVAGLSQHELWPLTSSPARWLGQRSYSLYLWHPFVAAIFFYQFRLDDGVAMLACVLLISLFIAHTTHRFLERPLRDVGRQLAARAGHAEAAIPSRSGLREAAA